MKILEANKAVTAKFGVAGLKAALDLTGFFGGEPRSPLSGLTKTQKENLTNILKKAEIIK
jgi:4-hydroxy-2-oxoglutarate aldolase